MLKPSTPHVTFVCVRNRVRSTFAQFYLEDIFRKNGEKVTVSSAGFVPQMLKDHLDKARIPWPEPLFDAPMSRLAREFLLEKGIRVPQNWRSKELSQKMVERSDLVITALVPQKMELRGLYKESGEKIFAIRELSQNTGYLVSEDFSALSLDQDYWYSAEEEPQYVSRVLREWENTLLSAIPNIMRMLGISKDPSVTSSD